MFNKAKSKSHNRLLMEKDYTTLCYTLCARTLSSQSPESIILVENTSKVTNFKEKFGN